MRLTPALLVGLVALATVSAQAAPNQANWVDLGATPLDLVAQSCGHNWLRTRSRDHWGYWHWGHCIPYGRDHDGADAVWDAPQGWTALSDQLRGRAGHAVAEDCPAQCILNRQNFCVISTMIGQFRSSCAGLRRRPLPVTVTAASSAA
jgi:hypothetical protein